ncbi:DUF926-domain-containing protein [Coprinellus micaceus]|uniref:DUF926-domain-containing protein n=1 Tax=Coprinellus micaceus TaxID=71717 RepID=A0A4Y7T2U1_COPMI|nr:DUF926-domain-containing protein [Coprinellus micaceus]
MATIHPSRMGLVPHNGSSSAQNERKGRSRSRDREDARHGGYSDRRDNGYGRRDNGYERRDGGYERRDNERRPSPSYDDYRRQPPPHLAHSSQPPPRNMYPNRGGGYGGGRPPGGMGNSDWFESRRAQREGMTVDVWPPSPKEPSRSLSPKRKKSSRKSKRARSPSTDTTDSSEEERRRRKEKRRTKKDRRREEKDRERKKSRRSLSRSPNKERERRKDYDSDEDEEERRRRRDRSRSRSKIQDRRSRSRSPRVESVARSPSRSPSPMSDQRQTPTLDTAGSTAKGKGKGNTSDSEEDVGPQPAFQASAAKRLNERDYGGALLRGEGTAMAAFLQDDPNMRIPRRGEIGLSSDQIAKYEDSGYVMSGSRHKRMNAVRMRKENQVISAEEKRGILKLQKEERERREAILREEFNEMVNEKLKAANVNVGIASTERRSPSP